MNVNWIDLILSGIFIYGSIVGFKKGLVREVASLFGLFISIISVFYFSDKLSNLIEMFLNLNSTVAYIISCLLIFLTVISLVSYLAKIITKALSIIALGFLNRMTGLIFGLFKWIIISSSIIFIINKILFLNEFTEQLKGNQMETSIMYSPLSEVGDFIFEKINTNTNEEEWKYL